MFSRDEVIKKDVIVVGGGMAGVSAAISAAEHGCDVLILEQLSCLGGLATAGLVTPMMGATSHDGKKVISGNVDKIFSCLKRYEACCEYSYDPEMLKYILDNMLSERKVDILFSTVIHDVVKQDKQISKLVGISKSGIAEFEGKVIVDCTGDANIAYRAGVHCEVGRESDGMTQAVSLRFILGNVDADKANHFASNKEGISVIIKALAALGKKTGLEIWDGGLQTFKIPGRPNDLVFNCPRLIGVNTTDSEALSNAYLEGRKRIFAYLNLVKENIPGCENAYISNSAALLGVRESRGIQGDYILNSEDIVEGRKFSDGIACNAWFIDIHNPKGFGILDRAGNLKGDGNFEHPDGGWCDIPFRSLYSSHVENLLVAGRCASATHEALAAIRISSSCVAMGQAAGTAASLMIKSDKKVNEINVNLLRRELANDGALITGVNL